MKPYLGHILSGGRCILRWWISSRISADGIFPYGPWPICGGAEDSRWCGRRSEEFRGGGRYVVYKLYKLLSTRIFHYSWYTQPNCLMDIKDDVSHETTNASEDALLMLFIILFFVIITAFLRGIVASCEICFSVFTWWQPHPFSSFSMKDVFQSHSSSAVIAAAFLIIKFNSVFSVIINQFSENIIRYFSRNC